MKILLISPVHPKLAPKKPLPTYQVQNYWLKALTNLGHQVSVLPLLKKQLKVINAYKLRQVIKSFQPDHIIFSAGLDKLPPINQTVFFSGVPPQTLSTTEKKIGKQAKLIVVNDSTHKSQWQKLTKTKVINLPFSAVDPSIFHPVKTKKTVNFSFIGTLFSNRQQQLADIINQGIDLKIWGWLPPKINLHPVLRLHYQGEAWGNKVVKIYQQSKMALNLVPDHMTDGGNLRTFEIPACQTLQFIDRINPDYYQPEKEIIMFNSPKDLKTKLYYYLTNPLKANKIAKAGYQKTNQVHNFNYRFKKLLELL